MAYLTLDLHNGNNLISFPYLPDDTHIGSVLNQLEDIVWVKGIIGEGTAASNMNDGLGSQNWVGSLSQIEYEKSYWVILDPNLDGEISFEFFDSWSPPGEIPVYELHTGANMASYIGNEGPGLTISAAIPDDVEGEFTGVIGEGVATQQISDFNWVGNLANFQAGRGYWMKVNSDISFSFPCTDDSCPIVLNEPPVAVIDPTYQFVYYGDTVTLSGVTSYDLDNDTINDYNFTCESYTDLLGNEYDCSDYNQQGDDAITTYEWTESYNNLLSLGTYQFSLVVQDDQGNFSTPALATVEVMETVYNGSFEINKDPDYEPSTVTFSNLSYTVNGIETTPDKWTFVYSYGDLTGGGAFNNFDPESDCSEWEGGSPCSWPEAIHNKIIIAPTGTFDATLTAWMVNSPVPGENSPVISPYLTTEILPNTEAGEVVCDSVSPTTGTAPLTVTWSNCRFEEGTDPQGEIDFSRYTLYFDDSPSGMCDGDQPFSSDDCDIFSVYEALDTVQYTYETAGTWPTSLTGYDSNNNSTYPYVATIIVYEPVGCTDSGACNYDPDAVVDDESCAQDWSDYGGFSNGADCNGECGGGAFMDDCGLCSNSDINNCGDGNDYTSGIPESVGSTTLGCDNIKKI